MKRAASGPRAVKGSCIFSLDFFAVFVRQQWRAARLMGGARRKQMSLRTGECGQLYSVSPCVLELPQVLIEVHSAVLDLISLLIPVVRESDLFMFCIYGEAGLAGGPHLSL